MTNKEVTAKVMEITPAQAAKWLENSTNFRKLSQRRVDAIAAIIKKGDWDLNGETVKLNGDGTLKDGQHRLAAVVAANEPIRSVVVFGIATDMHVDTGKARTFGEWLTYHGEHRPFQLAAATKFVWDLKAGKFDVRGGRQSGTGPSRRDLVECLNKNPGLRNSIVEADVGKLLPSSVFGGLHYIFGKKNKSLANDFFSGIRGELVVENRMDPVEKLRIILIKDAAAREHMSVRHRAALCIKAWNYWRSGTEVTTLRFVATGPSREAFPKIK